MIQFYIRIFIHQCSLVELLADLLPSSWNLLEKIFSNISQPYLSREGGKVITLQLMFQIARIFLTSPINIHPLNNDFSLCSEPLRHFKSLRALFFRFVSSGSS